jgi:hypothetical protein
MALALRQIPGGLLPGARRDFPVARGGQFYTCAPGFRKTDRDGLLGGGCSMLTFAHMVYFFPHKLSRLRAGRFSFAGVLASAIDGLLFRHMTLLYYKPSVAAFAEASTSFCRPKNAAL